MLPQHARNKKVAMLYIHYHPFIQEIIYSLFIFLPALNLDVFELQIAERLDKRAC